MQKKDPPMNAWILSWIAMVPFCMMLMIDMVKRGSLVLMSFLLLVELLMGLLAVRGLKLENEPEEKRGFPIQNILDVIIFLSLFFFVSFASVGTGLLLAWWWGDEIPWHW